ncbi:MAG: ABC transporter ATP-binding protein [Sarcina sp.]
MDYILKTDKLTKKYGNKIILDNLKINIPRGSIYGLIGKNGAGKTTLMRIVSGLTNPTSGSYELNLKNSINNNLKKVGILIENPGLYVEMSATENINYFKLLFGVKDKEDTDELLRVVGLENCGKKKVANFSLGMKQRLGIAISLIGNPELIILDEPINGLDAQGVIEIRNIIKRLNSQKGVTVIISSHILSELSKLATNYGIINEGQVIEEFDNETLLKRCSNSIKLIVELEDVEKTIKILHQNIGSNKFSRENLDCFKIFEDISSVYLNNLLVANEIKVRELSYDTQEVEEYFVEKISGGVQYE